MKTIRFQCMLATLLTLCIGAAAETADAAIYLQALTPTSGDNAETLLDGKKETSWSPFGEPAYEGVLFRFEEETNLDKVRIVDCNKTSTTVIVPYVNAVQGKSSRSGNEHIVPLRTKTKDSIGVKSLFLRVEQQSGSACLSEVTMELAGKTLPVKPPRSVRGHVTVSSTLAPAAAYHKGYLFDGRTDFGWVEGVKSLGVGESITIQLDQPRNLVGLEIWNGYQRSEDHFKKNARAKTIDISIDGGSPKTLDLRDIMGPQKIDVPGAKALQKLHLTVRDAFKGTRYADLVSSELRLWDKDGPLTIATSDLNTLSRDLRAKLAKGTLSHLIDKHLVSACSHEEHVQDGPLQMAATFKLRSNHTFAWYETHYDGQGRFYFEVFDGTWVPDGQQKYWSTVKLYGRRNVAERDLDFDSYALRRKREQTKIGGGKLQIARIADLGPKNAQRELQKLSKAAKGAKFNCFDHLARPKGSQWQVPIKGAGDFDRIYSELTKRSAVLVKGRAITDVLWRPL